MTQNTTESTFFENVVESGEISSVKESRKKATKRTTKKDGQKKESDIRVGGHAVGLLLPKKKEKQNELIADLHLNELTSPDGVQAFSNSDPLEKKVETITNALTKITGLKNPQPNPPLKIGLELSDSYQRRILFAVLQMMSQTNYQGNYSLPTEEALKGTYSKETLKLSQDEVVEGLHLAGPYKNIKKIPVISTTVANLARIAGYDSPSGAEWNRIKDAIDALASRQYFMMWKRLQYDKKGKPKKDEQGRYIYGYASEYCPILRVVNIYDEKQQFVRYDISLPAVFMDQLSPEFGGNLFMLIPQGWLLELGEHMKGAKQSPILATFALHLRKTFQTILSENRKLQKEGKPERPYRITQTYEELCFSIGVSESVMKINKQRTEKMIEKFLGVLKDVGYIISGKLLLSGEYEIVLNPDYYPNPYIKGEIEQEE